MSSKRKKTTRKGASKSSNVAPVRFQSDYHKERFESVKKRNFVSERVFNLKDGGCTKVQQIQGILVSNNWTHFPSIMKSVNVDVMREFYANAYLREGEVNEFTSWEERRFSTRFWHYDELLSFLARPSTSWKNFVPNDDPGHVPKKLSVTDLTPMAKAWNSFFHHTIETCANGSELKSSRAIAIMAVMKGRPVDICSLIAKDIFQIVKSGSRTMGHASLIVELGKHAEVDDLSRGEIVSLTKAIDNNWIQRVVNECGKDQQHMQVDPPHEFGEETSREHLLRMEDFCFKQDVCARLGISVNYLVHQTDTWAAAQRYKERYSGPPPGPHFGWFQPYPLPQPRL
ncbi:hypothetical protein TSUD_61090 [Trifolium subterraneum]|uniref:Putative plant transposon protein domain-containing protein n=1 Tax=Trifolium subterraneum TaxID=3900 RepID=A0A2Z6MNS9_TRISU|nr:hypothetical protein TSUD_61090 [Trifolium subterraneum]